MSPQGQGAAPIGVEGEGPREQGPTEKTLVDLILDLPLITSQEERLRLLLMAAQVATAMNEAQAAIGRAKRLLAGTSIYNF